MVRIKNRYLLVNILYPELEKSAIGKPPLPDVITFNQPSTSALTVHHLQRAIKAEAQHLFGDYGGGAIKNSLQVKYLSTATSTFIIRVSRDHYRIAWAALSFMNRVPVDGGKRCVFRVVRVSGTMRKVQEEAIRRARGLILKAQREGNEQGEKTLEGLLGKVGDQGVGRGVKDVLMVDGSDGEESDSDG